MVAVSLKNGWYVTAIIICVFWIPVSALSYWRWSRHQDEEREELTVVKALTPKQDVAVIAAMSWLYTSGRIRVNGKFRTVLFSLLIGSVVFGVFTLLGSLVPFTRPFVQGIFANPALAIGLDVLGIVLASLFLVSDFSMIDTCVKEGYAKEYEWTAAFGLVFTVIWLYLKILELIIRIAGNSKK